MSVCDSTNEKRPRFAFDVNMTEACTLRCTYCIENFNKPKFEHLSDENFVKITEKFDALLSSKDFKEKFSGIDVFFWGGEPTQNFKGIEKFVERYKDNDEVAFFIYSNGYQYSERILDYLESYKDKKSGNGKAKIELQISYDGLASHDIARVNIKGKGSALKVKENIFKVAERGIPFSIHPTIAFEQFNCISDNYFEFKRMSEILKIPMIYSPTIDYLSDHKFSEEELNEKIEILKTQFKKIKNDEIEFYLKNKMFALGFLNPNKKFCAAGKNMNAIELDGKVYACHGVLNGSSKEKLFLNTINSSNEDFISNLLKTSKMHYNTEGMISEECKTCETHYCLKCNSKKFDVSDKETFEERWTDYSNQPHLCKVYKFFGDVRNAFLGIIQNRINNKKL